MKLAVAQINCIVGDLSGNAAKILQFAEQARQQHVALLLTPELSLCGYPPEDLLLRDGFYRDCDMALQALAQAIADITVVVGHPCQVNGRFYNAASVLQDGKIVATYHKQILPNHSVFDEKRYFAADERACVFQLDGIKFAINICADIWEKEPAANARAAGAQVLLVLNASPYAMQKHMARYRVVQTRVDENQFPVVYANMVGGQDELIFDGGSFVVNAAGDVVAQAGFFDEALMLLDLQKGLLISGELQPLPVEEEAVYRALCLGVRDYVNKNRFPGVLLGLSGGIDSALTLAIAVDALGADKVHAVMMPSPYTAQISLDDSREMIRILGARYDEFSIESLFNGYLQVLHECFLGCAVDTTEENLQARIRGTLLMALSNKFGSVVLTTGNKSEMSVGYATLYGDMAGGFAVLKDVCKTLVYKLSNYRNSLGCVIPERIITRPPSAELRPDQTDQDSLPPYDVLDGIVSCYMENNLSIPEIVSRGYLESDVRKVVRLIRVSEYKRRQSAIGVRITERGYGKDWRYPVTVKYQDGF